MRATLFLALFSFISIAASAQNVDLDKNTGMVTVDGKDAFYLIKKNKNFTSFDLSLQNLNKEEIAFFACKDVAELPWDERGNNQGLFFRMVFSETGNTANVFPNGFNVTKNVAKIIVTSNLIRDNKIDPKAEKIFVVSKNGKIYKDPENRPVTITVTAPPSTDKANKQPADITIKGNSIYNNAELVGNFRNTTDSTTMITTVAIYKKDDSKVATATHDGRNANADWQVSFVADGKASEVLYNTIAPLEKLFKFLVDKGYL